MKIPFLLPLTAGLPFALAISLSSRCEPSTFASVLPSNATLIYAVPYAANSTFDGTVSVNPAFYAVYVNVTSSNSSAFEFGLWLPTETWNERYIAYGNGGFIGQVSWSDMTQGLDYGFAAVSTNTGHNSSSGAGGTIGATGGNSSMPGPGAMMGEDGSWALNAPEKRTDWGWRALHGSVSLGKTLTAAFYNTNIKYSYYAGCSTGGRQGLKSLQMFPEDFDGVLAGAPAWWTTHLQNWNLKTAVYNLPNNASYHLSTEDFSLIGKEIFRQCDAVDGLADGIINNPYACDFRPETLVCNSTSTSNSSNCLTSDQIDTVYKYYNDWVDVNQTFVFPGFTYGSEAQFAGPAISTNESTPSGIAYARYFLYNDPNWPWEDLDYSTVEYADATDPGNATADDFDLRPFVERGGKLIHYHGLADGSISVGASIYFWNHVTRLLQPQGIDLSEFYRLFLIPGMQHCSGNVNNAPWYIAGANQARSLSGNVHSVPGYEDQNHDALLALMAWVENGTAPSSIIGTKYVEDDPEQGVMMQRPLCPYPQEAKYTSGNPNVTSSFECGEI